MTPERRVEIGAFAGDEEKTLMQSGKSGKMLRECLAEIDRLTEQWQELLDAHRSILEEECSGSDDRVHCTCVPFLRQEIDRLTAENAACADDVRNMAASLDNLSREIDRLNKVVDQAINWIPNIDRKCIVPQGCYAELAAELERRSKA